MNDDQTRAATASRGVRPGARILRGLAYAPAIVLFIAVLMIVATPPLLLFVVAAIDYFSFGIVAMLVPFFLGLQAFALVNYVVVYRLLEACRLLHEVTFLAASVVWPGVAWAIARHITRKPGWLVEDSLAMPGFTMLLALFVSAIFWRLSAPADAPAQDDDRASQPEPISIGPADRGWAQLRNIAAAMVQSGSDRAQVLDHLQSRGLSRESAQVLADDVCRPASGHAAQTQISAPDCDRPPARADG